MCYYLAGMPEQLLGKKRTRTRSVASALLPAPSSSSITKTQPRGRGRVLQFSETVDSIGTSDTTSIEDVQNMWYQQTELAVFKAQARNYVLGLGSGSALQESRGYERYDVRRAQRKATTRKITLLACSQKGLTQDDVARIVTRSTSWAVKEGLRSGLEDFCEVYFPEMKASLSEKRSRESSAGDCRSENRSVRRRVC
mmetsp:Transcript_20103/g.37578  ORF Transcript_20103/g.37578 Transcript_20103/m.37578 type:complete len:197 (+) Transcript_20103:88-678(+)